MGAVMPKYEVRGVWLTTLQRLDWPRTVVHGAADIERQKVELREILDSYRRANINTVFLQTRIRATSLFPTCKATGYEPWDAALTDREGGSPGYDPLQYAVEECHRRGMELHAWIVTIPVGKWNALGCRMLRKKKPAMVMKIADEGYMDPACPETAEYLSQYCAAIARRYDIDGIHLDYIRYPETMHRIPKQGRENISRIVKAIYEGVRKEKGWVRISCAPIGKYDDTQRYSSKGWNARSRVCQDVVFWMERGWIDMALPMMYFNGENFYPFLVDWKERGGSVVPGLGAYMLHPRQRNWSLSEIVRQMSVSRSMGMGFCFFRSSFFTEDVKGLYRFVATSFAPYPALIPPKADSGEERRRPLAPERLTLYVYGGKAHLAWCGARDNSNGNYLMYNVYASSTFPVDVSKAENILAVRVCGTTLCVPSSEMYYAVTATDRYGMESAACQMYAPEKQREVKPGWFWVTHPLGR